MTPAMDADVTTVAWSLRRGCDRMNVPTSRVVSHASEVAAFTRCRHAAHAALTTAFTTLSTEPLTAGLRRALRIPDAWAAAEAYRALAHAALRGGVALL